MLGGGLDCADTARLYVGPESLGSSSPSYSPEEVSPGFTTYALWTEGTWPGMQQEEEQKSLGGTAKQTADELCVDAQIMSNAHPLHPGS